jgi:hypothetical protein
MGQAKDSWAEDRRNEAEKQNRTDHVAKGLDFVCERCHEPLPREFWGIQKLCSYCQQIWDHS